MTAKRPSSSMTSSTMAASAAASFSGSFGGNSTFSKTVSSTRDNSTTSVRSNSSSSSSSSSSSCCSGQNVCSNERQPNDNDEENENDDDDDDDGNGNEEKDDPGQTHSVNDGNNEALLESKQRFDPSLVDKHLSPSLLPLYSSLPSVSSLTVSSELTTPAETAAASAAAAAAQRRSLAAAVRRRQRREAVLLKRAAAAQRQRQQQQNEKECIQDAWSSSTSSTITISCSNNNNNSSSNSNSSLCTGGSGNRCKRARVEPTAALDGGQQQQEQQQQQQQSSTLIPPTLQGMEQLAHAWSQGKPCAIPTECTYEVSVVVPLTTSSTTTRPNRHHHNNNNYQTKDASHQTGWLPDLQLAANATSLVATSAETTAMTTTLTRPALDSIPRIVYATPDAVNDCPLFRGLWQERAYAFRKQDDNQSDSDKKVLAVTSFSESMQVVQRLATKVWPGPVVMMVALPKKAVVRNVVTKNGKHNDNDHTNRNSEDMAKTMIQDWISIHKNALLVPCQHADNDDHEDTDPTYYLALRCPNHPLAIKAVEELNRLQRDLRHAGQGNESDSSSSSDSGVKKSCLPHGNHVLVSLPMKQSEGNGYVCCAQAATVTHEAATSTAASSADGGATHRAHSILNGEEQLEMFSVPTCELGHPGRVTLWIDENRRTVRLKSSSPGTSVSQQLQVSCAQLMETLSSSSNNSNHGGRSSRNGSMSSNHRSASPLILPDTPRKSMTLKDRVVQAVLRKWTVVEEPEE